MTARRRARQPCPPASWWTGLGAGLADLVLGERCAGCGGPPGSWCSGCSAAMGEASVVGAAGGRPLASAGRYEGPLGRAVVAHKERGRLVLAEPLGRLLADAVLALPCPAPALLVPVPSTARAVRGRGQDHAARLAAAAASHLRREGRAVAVLRGLRVVRPVRDQAGLTAGERHANVMGAFAVSRRAARTLSGARCVVVDDVVTTGSSLAAAVEAVRSGGGQVTGCAVVAHAGGQGPSGPRCPQPPRLA